MARELIAGRIKQIIDALKENNSMTWSDLKTISKLPDKTLGRYLRYLKYWELAKKDAHGSWQWSDKFRVYETRHDYELALRHSKKLLKALDGFLGFCLIKSNQLPKPEQLPIKTQEALYAFDMVRLHLRTGYPQLHSEIIDFEKLLDLIREITEELEECKPKIEKEHLLEYVALFKSLKRYAIPKRHWIEVERLVNCITPEQQSLIERTDENYWNSLVRLSNELRHLVSKVENGEPLEGICNLCPTARVKRRS